jgi:hypothetical protein
MDKFRFAAGAMLLTLAAPTLAVNKDLADARSQCQGDQQTLQRLEANADWCTDDTELLRARDAAERSCGRAMQLMVSLGLEPKPVTPQPAPPPPSLTIVERVRTNQPGPDRTTVEVASFAAMEADRRCENEKSR